MRRATSFDILSVKICLTDSLVGEFKNQKSVVNFEQEGCVFHLYGGAKTPGLIEPKFCLMVGVHDIITPFKFGDDRFRGFWLAEGQILPFSIYFEDRLYHSHTIV